MESIKNTKNTTGTIYNLPSKRSYRFDILKAIAIVCVVLYHFGFLKNGYLGVDIFFVISGFFLMNSYLKKKDSGHFSFLKTIGEKITRFLPLIFIVSIISLCIGFFTMLPDDFENLGESVVASNVFCENLLSAVTIKNYWNISNNYSPLMHLWYIGLLFQAELFLLLVFKIADRFGRKILIISLVILFVGSFALYLLPFIDDGYKFYLFPFRLFELLAGSLLCFINYKKKGTAFFCVLQFILTLFLIALMLISLVQIPNEVYLIITVAMTSLCVFLFNITEERESKIMRWISFVGQASFSIYITHQPVLAFTRYLYTANFTFLITLIDIVIIGLLSYISYLFIEKRLYKVVSGIRPIKRVIAICIPAVLICSLGGIVYLRAGVFRDYPELNIYASDVRRGMHAEYVDIPYSWDKDFEDIEKKHLLVVGDSMARDWCNILNESQRADQFEISYIYFKNIKETHLKRIDSADYIFYSSYDDSRNVPELLEPYVNNGNFYVVGIKNFGESNGQVYQKRYQKDYFKTRVKMGYNTTMKMSFLEQNNIQKNHYKDHYIDLIKLVIDENQMVPVFSDTNKFLSADTEHLTKDGAVFFSKLVDLNFID